MTPQAENYVYALLPDGSEVFGTKAFPFFRNSVRAVVFSCDDRRQVLAETQCTVLRVLHPERVDGLPSERLWLSANDDAQIRAAVKERCGL